MGEANNSSRSNEGALVLKKLLLKDFSEKYPVSFKRLIQNVSDPFLLELLIDIMTKRGKINLSDEIKEHILVNHNGWEFFHELMKNNCSLCDVTSSMCLRELYPAKEAIVKEEKLQVIEEPAFPEGVVFIFKGETLNLRFLTCGVPFPQFQWFFNETAIKDQDDYLLSLPNFQAENEGFYYCIAEQCYKGRELRVKSKKIKVNLEDWNVQFIKDLPVSLKCYHSMPFELSVIVDCAKPVNYAWYHNNQLLLLETSNMLKVDSANHTYKGEYRCSISYEGTTLLSEICKVEVVPYDCNETESPPAKLALLIGNNDYNDFKPLSAGKKDVQLLAYELLRLGFQVTCLINLSRDEMNIFIKWFSEFIEPYSYVLFYFSGHGFLHANTKLMMPIDSPPLGSMNVNDCINEDFVKHVFFQKLPLLYIEVLDMCLTDSERSAHPKFYDEDGLARVEKYTYDNFKTTTICAYPTKNFQKTYEHPSDMQYMSYSKCLSKHLTVDLPVNQIFINAHKEFTKINQIQTPTLSTEDSTESFRLNVDVCGSLDPEDLNSRGQILLQNLKDSYVHHKFEMEFSSYAMEEDDDHLLTIFEDVQQIPQTSIDETLA